MAYSYSNGTGLRVNLSGDIDVSVIAHANEEYHADVTGMPGEVGDFDNEEIFAPEGDVETSGTFDEAKFWKWCWDVSTATQSNDGLIEGQVNIGGYIEFSNPSSNSTQHKIKTLNFVDSAALAESYWIEKEDIEEEGNIDPGKILIYLLKKLKEALCPSCE